MNNLKSSLTILSLMIITMQSFTQESGYKLYRIFAEDFTGLRDIESRGVNVFNSRIGEYMDIEASGDNIRKLEADGYRLELLADNYRDLLDMRFKTGSYEEYHNHQETIALLSDFREAFPGITKLDTIGFSVLGRAICAIKISDNVNEDEDEIPVLMVGNHHGNEILSVEATLYQIDYLLNNYGSDQEVTHWIDNMEIWYVPMLNPDGREDLRRTNDNRVDLNRNYSFAHTAEGNHGPYGFSEPETQAIRDLAANFPPALSLTYHTSGRLVLLPWTHTDEAAPDSMALSYLGNKIAESITYPSGGGTGHYELRQGGDWYFTAGEYCDYMYATHNTHGYTIEMHTSQTPPADVIPAVVERNLEGMKTLFREAFRSNVTGKITDVENGDPVVAKIHFPFIDDQGKLPGRFSEKDFGRYYKYLAPGTYPIEVSAPGYRTVKREVVIVEDRQSILDVELEPAPELALESYFFSDTTNNRVSGNGDGKINIGETAGIVITLQNHNMISASGTFLKASTESRYVNILTDSLYFGSITPDSQKESPDTLLFSLSANCPDGEIISFDLAISDEISYAWNSSITLEAYTPDIILNGKTINDVAGNSNGIIDAGERVSVSIEIMNTGRQNVNKLEFVLQGEDRYFEIINGETGINELGKNETGHADFEIELAPDCPDIYLSYFDLFLSSEEGYEKTIKIQLDNINGFFDQFENGENGWTHASYGSTQNDHDDWQLGLPAGKAGDPSYCYSGVNCWGTDHGWDSYLGDSWNGEYQDNVYNFLMSPSIDCSGMTEVGLRYRRWLNTSVYDIASIMVNDNLVWRSSVRGHSDQAWEEHLIDISEYADGNKDVRIKFEMKSGSSNALGGWNIDDLLVADKLASGTVSARVIEAPGKSISAEVYPNPFRENTTIEFRLSDPGSITMEIFNMEGRLVKSKHLPDQPAGVTTIDWDGKSNNGRKLGNGFYYLKLKGPSGSETIPVLLLK